ncbi:uncharacterized protein [Porites lutea]|uniref:uncharacterized protein n=1 Tax=Porites lutea TaxID=51062 RepID=UPI003CC6A552
MNTRAVHLELAVDYSTVEFMQTLRRFFAIRGQPALMMSDNGSQLVGTEHKLREMIQGWNHKELKEFSAKKGMRWQFIMPRSPHQMAAQKLANPRMCPNDMLLGRATSMEPQGPFRETRNPRHRVKFVQKTVDTFMRRWTRDMFPSLVPRKKWNAEKHTVRLDDIVIMEDSNSVRGNWTIGRIINVYPGRDGRV